MIDFDWRIRISVVTMAHKGSWHVDMQMLALVHMWLICSVEARLCVRRRVKSVDTL